VRESLPTNRKTPGPAPRRVGRPFSGRRHRRVGRPSAGGLAEPEAIRRNGAVYTPPNLADYVATRLVSLFLSDRAQAECQPGGPKQRTVTVLDPACGDAELLLAVQRAALEASPAGWSSGATRPKRIRLLLAGVDTDARAVAHAKKRLCRAPHQLAEKARVLKGNSLCPFGLAAPEGWSRLLRVLGAPGGFDLMIANPPWGADIGEYKDQLRPGAFALLRGQFDTSDLFLEAALSLTRPGGYLAFIVPDSLFAVERERLRRFLLERTELKLLARLGEGIFGGVNRACAVLVCRNSAPDTRSVTRCFRLLPDLRRKVLTGRLRFEKAEDSLAHNVPQERFAADAQARFDIDVSDNDAALIQRLRNQGAHLSAFLSGGRGVELSKSGQVVLCRHCANWSPLPRQTTRLCSHCGALLTVARSPRRSIVSTSRGAGYRRFVAGEDVGRHSVRPGRWILANLPGINYKGEALYRAPKLLVRKTGVGITAGIDYSSALTNQVVYVFHLRQGMPGWLPLEFFSALLNSRVGYYYIAKTYGEAEWRSHPYLTQKHVLDFPAPPVDQLARHKQVMRRFGRLIAKKACEGRLIDPLVDVELERGIAVVLGFTRKEYLAIYRYLDSVQQLLPVRSLKSIAVNDLFPT